MKTSSSVRTSNGNSKKKGNDRDEQTGGSGSKGTTSGTQPGTAVTLNGKIKAEHFQSDREAFLNAFESKGIETVDHGYEFSVFMNSGFVF